MGPCGCGPLYTHSCSPLQISPHITRLYIMLPTDIVRTDGKNIQNGGHVASVRVDRNILKICLDIQDKILLKMKLVIVQNCVKV